MNIPAYSKSFSTVGRVLACAGAFLVAAQFTRAADQVDVFLTGLKFGSGTPLHATSFPRTIEASPTYEYTLKGKIRGTPGTRLAKVIKVGTTLDQFVLALGLDPNKVLKGTFTNPNPGGALPVTFLNRKIKGTRTVKDLGEVKFSFRVVGEILETGECVVDLKNVSIKTTPALKLGTITFSKGSVLNIKVIP